MIFLFLPIKAPLSHGYFYQSSSLTDFLDHLDTFPSRSRGVVFELGDVPEFSVFTRCLKYLPAKRPKQLKISEEAL